MTFAALDLRVWNLIPVKPIVIDADAPASEAERLLKTHRVSGLPVTEGGTTVGVISQTDLVTARSSGMISANWERLRVRHLMTAPAVTAHAETSIARVARLMVTRHIHRVVVVDSEEVPIGVISSLDLLRVLLDGPDSRRLTGRQLSARPATGKKPVAGPHESEGTTWMVATCPAMK